MASRFFKTKLNVGKKLQSMKEGESFVMELSDNSTFFDCQKNIQSYATRYRIKLANENLKAISESDQVIRLLRVTHKGEK